MNNNLHKQELEKGLSSVRELYRLQSEQILSLVHKNHNLKKKLELFENELHESKNTIATKDEEIQFLSFENQNLKLQLVRMKKEVNSLMSFKEAILQTTQENFMEKKHKNSKKKKNKTSTHNGNIRTNFFETETTPKKIPYFQTKPTSSLGNFEMNSNDLEFLEQEEDIQTASNKKPTTKKQINNELNLLNKQLEEIDKDFEEVIETQREDQIEKKKRNRDIYTPITKSKFETKRLYKRDWKTEKTKIPSRSKGSTSDLLTRISKSIRHTTKVKQI
ncbi:hypothetical protein M0812_20193 [Anaeramoeba flamelloides]|uniref:Shugoshin C-terminal domain-containing protein n=1 Tax=Anaeramoeba flamelloides TaxID=1746091 RepID=A0AAV7YXB8_9EUKA|nr:hypothetical protein M0812_20193 [Anaeramoeba flamelloides]